MDVEILHSFHGDKSEKMDTETEAGRQKAAVLINRLMKQGAAVILQRGKKAYKVKGYNPKTDTLMVQTAREEFVAARGKKSQVTAVAPSAGG